MATELQNVQILSEGSGSRSGTDYGVDSSQVNRYEIMRKVLGDRSDYQRGVGYRGKAQKITSSSSSQSQTESHPSRPRYSDEDIATMATMMKQM